MRVHTSRGTDPPMYMHVPTSMLAPLLIQRDCKAAFTVQIAAYPLRHQAEV